MSPPEPAADDLSAQRIVRAGAICCVHEVANNRKLRRTLGVMRYPLGMLAVAMIALWAEREWFFIGMSISLFGEAIQVWCFSSLSKQKTLAARGPYALVRNPMYLGRYFALLGGVMITGSGTAAIVFSAVYYFYMVNRVAREEAVLACIFGEAYADYCRRVNRFLPSVRGLDLRDVWFFNRQFFLTNHAHWHVLGFPAAYALLYCFTFLLKIGTEPYFHIEWI